MRAVFQDVVDIMLDVRVKYSDVHGFDEMIG